MAAPDRALADAARARTRPRVPLARVSTSEALVNVLTRNILDGVIAPGERLLESDIADEHGVSRQSLRSAFAELAHLGLVKREAHRGAWVPQMTRRQVRDLWDLRTILEVEAVRRTSRQPTDWSGLEQATRRLDGLTNESSWAEAVEGDVAFHRELVAAAGSPQLTRAHANLLGEMRLSLAGNAGSEVPGFMAGDHRRLLESFQTGDAEGSIELLQRHLLEGLGVVTAPMPEGD